MSISYTVRKRIYFLVSFLCAFLAFWLVFLVMMSAGQNHSAPRTAPANRAAAYQPSDQDALTLMLFGIESHGAVADTFVLLRFDPVRGQVGVAVFPPGTVLTHNDSGETLAEAYRFGGMIYTRDVLSLTLNIPIDRHARATLSGFVAAANAVGSVEFELYEPVTVSAGGQPVTLDAGVHLLDGRQVAELVRYRDFPGTEAARTELITRLTCAIIDQRIDIVFSTLLEQVFTTVVNLLDTDITFADFEQRIAGAQHMADQSEPVALPIALQGDFCQDGIRFTLHDTALAQIARFFL